MLKNLKLLSVWLFSHFFAFSILMGQEEIPLKVGMELSYPPFEMIDPQGHPTGISADIAYALGKFLNKTVEIENIPFVGLIPALKNRKIDVIISSLSISSERSASIDFSEPYGAIGLCLLVKKDSPIQSINDVNLPRVKVVVKSGTSGEAYALQNLETASVIVLDKEAACVLEIVQGKADAFIYDQFIHIYELEKKYAYDKSHINPF